MKLKPTDIWNEYTKLQEYLNRHNVYDTVKQNEDFYNGDQWEGVKSEQMPKPVINRIQRCVRHLVSSVSSNDIAISITPFTSFKDDIDRMKPISKEVENIIEQARIKEASKIVVRNACVDGASYMMQGFDAGYETNQDMKGRITNQIIDNTNMYFGNPYSNDIQSQPYIIVAFRQFVGQVKDEAKRLGLTEEEIEGIKPDMDSNQYNDDSEELVTVLLKYYKHRRTIKEVIESVDLEGNALQTEIEKEVESVWFTKCTPNVCLIKPTDLGYKRYPISCFGWEQIKNSFLYTSPVTQQIQNQIYVNKIYALLQMGTLQSTMPKTVYDKNKVNIDDILNSTSPIAVGSMDLLGKYLDFIKLPNMASDSLALVKDVIEQMNDSFGVTNTDLGNVKPDNTSAIIALQQASSVSLEIQKQNFFGFNEDTVRNILDIMSCTYGVRQVMVDEELADVDFSILRDLNYNLNVDIGSGAQYSEIAQINTLDKIYSSGMLQGREDLYVDLIPDKYILGKEKIKEALKQRNQLMQQQIAMANADPNLPM